MRVLVTPIGSAGDNYPLIGIGRELARRGHEVVVLTVQPFEAVVRGCGLGYWQIGTSEEFRASIADPRLWDPLKGFATVMALSEELNLRIAAAMEELVVPGRTIVVAHALDFASRSLLDRNGLPVVTIHLAPTIVRSNYEMPVTGPADLSSLPRWVKRMLWRIVDGVLIDPAARPIINRIRRRIGLRNGVQRPFKDWIHSPLLTVAMWPEWFGRPQPDWPRQIRCAGFPLFEPDSQGRERDEGLAGFLDGGEAPIVFTPGSANIHAKEFFAAAVGACGKLGRRGLLLTTHDEQIPRELPASVAHCAYAPLTRILPRCAALAHPGGIGSVAAGLAAGVPQVVLPLAHDQPDNAARVQRLGVGVRAWPQRLTADRLADALRPLLGEEVRGRCREIAARCAADNGIAKASDLIESVMPR